MVLVIPVCRQAGGHCNLKFVWDLLFEICNLLIPIWFWLVQVRDYVEDCLK